MIGELWTCCMDDMELWKNSLIRLHAQSNSHQLLTDEYCLGHLL